MKINKITKYILVATPFLVSFWIAVSSFSYFGKKLAQPYHARPGFILGINGHPLSGNRPTYLNMPVEDQIKTIHDLNLSYYRIDVICNSDGKITRESRFFELAEAAKKNNIKLLALMFAQNFGQFNDNDIAYKAGFKLASGFVTRYSQYFDHYELGNELDNLLITNRKLQGVNTSDYNIDKFKIAAAYLKGMHDGVKSVDPNAKTIIDMGETHVGFISLLKQYDVPFDIIGLHYYSKKTFDEEDDFRNTITGLLDVYDNTKPMWITEFNQFLGTADWGIHVEREDSQKRIINDAITNCSKISNIQALFIYELLDEPTLVVSRGQEFERNFGIASRDSNTSAITLKSMGRSLKFKR